MMGGLAPSRPICARGILQPSKAGDGIPSPWEHPGKSTLLEGHCSSPGPTFLTNGGPAESDNAGAFTQVSGFQPVEQGQVEVLLPRI